MKKKEAEKTIIKSQVNEINNQIAAGEFFDDTFIQDGITGNTLLDEIEYEDEFETDSDFDNSEDVTVIKSNTTSVRCRIMMYTQSVSRILKNFKSLDDFEQHIVTQICKNPDDRYAFIIHDKDISKKDGKTLVDAHIHVAFEFANAHSIEAIAKALKDYRDDGSVNVQTMKKFNGKVGNLYSYLCHRTKKAQEQKKHQYAPSIVRANFDYVAKLNEISTQVANAMAKPRQSGLGNNVSVLCEAIRNREMALEDAKKCLPAYASARHSHVLETSFTDAMQLEAKEWREAKIKSGKPSTIIWIWGEPGVGKSSFGRELAASYDKNYYPVGSQNDPWDTYHSDMHVALIDECRPEMFKSYREMLSILDPFQVRAVSESRYHNKELTLDVIIITSVFNPFKFYENMVIHNRGIDSFHQLERRISTCIYMNDFFIFESYRKDSFSNYTLDTNTLTHNPYSEFRRKKNSPLKDNRKDFRSLVINAPSVKEYYDSLDAEYEDNEEEYEIADSLENIQVIDTSIDNLDEEYSDEPYDDVCLEEALDRFDEWDSPYDNSYPESELESE